MSLVITLKIHIFHHVCAVILITRAVFYKGKISLLKKANVLSFGFNKMGDICGNQPGIHAEHDAINRLKPLKKKKHLQNVSLLVVRFSKNNKLQNSKPCANCINNMKILPKKKGYRITNIYFSNENGDIIKSNIKSLEKEEMHYSRFFRNKNNINNHT